MSNQQLPGKKLKKPKRPMTAYNFFFKSEHQKIRQESEGCEPEDEGGDKKEEASLANDSTATNTKKRKTNRVGFEDLGKLIGKRWKEIGKDELERYQELARKDSERYKRESEKYYEDQISALCMGYNKRSDDRPGLSATTTAATAVNPASFHTGMAQAPLTLAQEANLVMKAFNTSGGCPVSTEQQGQKSKRKKTAAEESLAASNSTTGTSTCSAVAAENGMHGTGVATSFNPAMAQMIGLSSNQQQQQWMQQQAMMMTMMMANPAFQAMQLAVHNNMMNRGTDGCVASSDTGASVDPAGNSRSSGQGITEGAADSRANSSAPRTGTCTSNDDNDEEEHDDAATTINGGTAKRRFI